MADCIYDSRDGSGSLETIAAMAEDWTIATLIDDLARRGDTPALVAITGDGPARAVNPMIIAWYRRGTPTMAETSARRNASTISGPVGLAGNTKVAPAISGVRRPATRG
jgi:hypothetical protein